MVTHIVMWRMKDGTPEQKRQSAFEAKQILEGLNGKVPGLLHIEAGLNYCAEPAAWDLVLYSTFTDRDSLVGYQTHPAHVEVVGQVKHRFAERAMVDYDN